jgi:hypothetical protein
MTTNCSECLAPSEELLATTTEDRVCPSCASEYFAPCADCKLLAARDETRESDGERYCLACFERIFAVPGVDSEADVEALVSEYVGLLAEQKQLDERVSDIKERLKQIAASRERIAGAVVLGDGDQTVKCSYRTDYKVGDPEKIEALESTLGPDRFAALFDRSVVYKPVKENVEEFLETAAEPDRALLRDALRITEVETLTAPRARKR